MPSEAELWAALGPRIINILDDDNLRLRFAENLESREATELNLIRARFIRVQLKLHSIRPDHSEWFSSLNRGSWTHNVTFECDLTPWQTVLFSVESSPSC